MLPESPAVSALIADCRSLAEEAFSERLLSVYLIGSLGHGGFIPAVSDIGVALLLVDPLVATDAEQISALAAYCTAAHPRHGRRLSIFWSSPAAFTAADEVQVAGRFPAVDRLDLLQHGRLIAGADLCASLDAPTRRAVLANCREDALRFVRDPARYGFLTGGADYDFTDRRALTRLCLFPPRFLHTVATGEVAANETATVVYPHTQGGSAAVIAALGLALRHEPARPLADDEVALLRAGLPGYYRQFLGELLSLLGGPALPDDATTPLLLTALAHVVL